MASSATTASTELSPPVTCPSLVSHDTPHISPTCLTKKGSHAAALIWRMPRSTSIITRTRLKNGSARAGGWCSAAWQGNREQTRAGSSCSSLQRHPHAAAKQRHSAADLTKVIRALLHCSVDSGSGQQPAEQAGHARLSLAPIMRLDAAQMRSDSQRLAGISSTTMTIPARKANWTCGCAGGCKKLLLLRDM